MAPSRGDATKWTNRDAPAENRYLNRPMGVQDRAFATNVMRTHTTSSDIAFFAGGGDLETAWKIARDLLVVIDTAGVFRAVNPAWTTILGWASDELIGRPVFDFVLPEDQQVTLKALATAIAGPLPVVENRYRHKDGSFRWISWVAAPNGNQIYANGRDITDEKARDAELAATQDALRQAQKMDAVGQLTGGIAHDFNNLLQGVAGSLDLIRRKPEDSARVLRWAEAGLQAAERGAKLAGQLLAFSRAQRIEAKPLLAPALIEGMRELLERTLGPGVAVVIDPNHVHDFVLADATQLELAVLNLAINARDAMPGGGELTIATRLLSIQADPELEPGEYVELSVTDNGAGMPPDVAARAFDPFFTTKDVGKGTGLGLSQAYGIARAAGGTARITSRLGQGTTIRLLLRKTEQPLRVSIDIRGKIDAKELAGSVLVVDDDADVRRFLIDSLDTLGFAVEAAEDGAGALALLDRSVPDVVILDYAMPGMNGAEVFRAARKRRPDLQIIFASGYSNTSAIEAVAGHDALILRKPFNINELQAAIGEKMTARH